MPWLALAQVASATAMFAFFFRLLGVGGPVYLSQIGYIAAAVGLAIGAAWLGERCGMDGARSLIRAIANARGRRILATAFRKGCKP